MNTTERTPLEVGFSDLSIGSYSVGLAPTRTGEQLIEAYLELITLVRRDRPDYLRDGDIDILAGQTGLDHGFIKNRVANHMKSIIPA